MGYFISLSLFSGLLCPGAYAVYEFSNEIEEHFTNIEKSLQGYLNQVVVASAILPLEWKKTIKRKFHV